MDKESADSQEFTCDDYSCEDIAFTNEATPEWYNTSTCECVRKCMDEMNKTDFVRNSSYMVRFPSQFGIPAYCVHRLWHGGDGSVVMEIIEPYMDGKTMIERLDDISKAGDFVIEQVILKPDNTEYYSEYMYVAGGSFKYRPQTIGYNINGIRTFSVTFDCEKISVGRVIPGDENNNTGLIDNFITMA